MWWLQNPAGQSCSSLRRTSFVRMTDSATSTLSWVSCTLFKPLLTAPFSIVVILYMNLMLDLFWLEPGCCVGDLKKHKIGYCTVCV